MQAVLEDDYGTVQLSQPAIHPVHLEYLPRHLGPKLNVENTDQR